jgi:DNA-binding XRE family transcriptional regulator
MFGKNIKKIRSVHGLSQLQFAEMFDLKRATLGAYEEGRSNPKMDTVIKIANHFSIDIEDLLTKELTVNRLLKFNETITTSPAVPKKIKTDGVPCVMEGMKSDYLSALKNGTKINLPVLIIPTVSPENKTAFVLPDNSMTGISGLFLPKDIIICGEITIQSHLADGSLVVVATKEDILFRKIYYSNDRIILKANNSEFKDIEVSTKDVLSIWKVLHIFQHTLPQENTLEQRVAILESALALLNKNN